MTATFEQIVEDGSNLRSTAAFSGDQQSTSIIRQLLGLGLISPRDVLDGDLKAVGVSRRNLNFRISSVTGASYFVKKAQAPGRARTIRHEAAFIRYAAASPDFAALRPYLPTLRGPIAEDDTLVFDLLPGSCSLAEHQLKTHRWSVELAGRIGRLLTTVQSLPVERFALSDVLMLDEHAPFVFSIHRPDLDVIEMLSGAALELIKIIQASDVIRESLDQLRANWQGRSIVHGDFKWDNIVVGVHPTRPRTRPIYIVDWEMVQLGDPLWDVASFLSQYLDAWIASIPIADNSSAPSAKAQTPLEILRLAMIRFWRVYTRGVGLTGPELSQAIERTTRYAAARLIQTAIEADQFSPRLSNTGILRLQVAENMLSRPLEAAATLLGIIAEAEVSSD